METGFAFFGAGSRQWARAGRTPCRRVDPLALFARFRWHLEGWTKDMDFDNVAWLQDFPDL
jgi:hypothetical protein